MKQHRNMSAKYEGGLMAITTLSSREFNQDTSRAKQAAGKGSEVIIDPGRPAHVLISIEYQKLVGPQATIVNQLAAPGVEDIEFDPPRVSGISPRSADLS